MRELVRDIITFPGTKPLLAALTELQAAGAHIAVVVDEYGGLAGIVRAGRDRHRGEPGRGVGRRHLRRVRRQAAPSQQDGPGLGEVDGLISPSEFRQRTGIELPWGSYDTVGGLVITRLGHVQAVGDEVEVDEHRLAVVAVDGWRLQRVLIAPIDPAAEP